MELGKLDFKVRHNALKGIVISQEYCNTPTLYTYQCTVPAWVLSYSAQPKLPLFIIDIPSVTMIPYLLSKFAISVNLG